MTESAFRDAFIHSSGTLNPNDATHLWAHFDLVCADADDFMFSALLKMMNHRIQRVVVTANSDHWCT